MARYFKQLELISLNSFYFTLFYVLIHVGWHPPPRVFRYSALHFGWDKWLTFVEEGLHWVVYSLLPNPYLHSSRHSDIRPLHKSFTKLLLKVGLPFDGSAGIRRNQLQKISYCVIKTCSSLNCESNELWFDWFHRHQMEPITEDFSLRNQNMFFVERDNDNCESSELWFTRSF